MSGFRDAVAAVTIRNPMAFQAWQQQQPAYLSAGDFADAFLAMPEMQAIKAVLNVLLERKAGSFEDAWDPDVWDALEALPASVAEWAAGA